MSAIMHRNAFKPGGCVYEFLDGKCRQLPPDVAYVQTGEGRYGQEHADVTWAEVMRARRERQAERLEWLRRPTHEPAVVPCYVWTFFNRQEIPYHGWHCYIISRQFEIGVNFKGFEGELAASIMAEIPLGFLALKDNFNSWMAAFARRYPRRPLPDDPRKAGLHYGWITNRQTFSVQRPTP